MEARTELRDRLHLLLEASAATRGWRAWLAEQVASCNLSDQEFLALWLCDDGVASARGQGELAASLGISAAQMSGLVERLRQRDLLSVERLGNDRRRQVWKLTASGANVLAAACQALLASPGSFRGWLSAGEIGQLQSLISRWHAGEQSTSDSRFNTPDQGGPSSCAA